MSWIRRISDRHERIKEYIHNVFRYPLPKYGQYIMGFVYFSIPVISGWYITQWAISKSHENIGYYGEKLPKKSVQGVGDKRPVVRTVPKSGSTTGVDKNGGDVSEETEQIIEYQKVGAGGWGGGVRLVVSDEEEQKRNRKKFRKFMKKLQREYGDADNVDKAAKEQPK